jgi:hypothetical protein
VGKGLLIANHLDESLRWANQKHWAALTHSDHHIYYYFILFSRCTMLVCLSAAAAATTTANSAYYTEPKLFRGPKNGHVLTFVHPILLCSIDHLLSTIGDALTKVNVPRVVWGGQFEGSKDNELLTCWYMTDSVCGLRVSNRIVLW